MGFFSIGFFWIVCTNWFFWLILLNFGLCMWFKIEKIFSWNFRYSRFGYISGWLEFKFRVFDDQVYGYPDLFLFFMDDQVCDFLGIFLGFACLFVLLDGCNQAKTDRFFCWQLRRHGGGIAYLNGSASALSLCRNYFMWWRSIMIILMKPQMSL